MKPKPKPKLKPQRPVRNVKPKYSIEYRKLYERAQALLPEKQASQLTFELMGIEEAWDHYKSEIEFLLRATHVAKRDSTDLWDAATVLPGIFVDFRGHMTRASRILNKLADKARNTSPLNTVTDMQLTERAIAACDEILSKPLHVNTGVPKKKIKKRQTKKSTKRTKR